MSLLDRYAKKETPQTERKTASLGCKIEPSLYTAFINEAGKLGLGQSEALRYLVIEFLRSAEVSDVLTLSEPLREKGINLINEIREEEKNNRTGTEVKTGSLIDWIIENQLPCTICGTWSSKKNFNRDHASKHNFTSSFEFLTAHKEKADQMVQDRLENYFKKNQSADQKQSKKDENKV
jgi:hypothetical protein